MVRTPKSRYKAKLGHITYSVVADAPMVAVREGRDAVPLLRAVIAREGAPHVEHFAVLALNARGEAIGADVVSRGSASSCIVHPAEVFRLAIALHATAIVVAHNHPSGSSGPSGEDVAITERLSKAGEILGIQVVDHIILGDRVARSLLTDTHISA